MTTWLVPQIYVDAARQVLGEDGEFFFPSKKRGEIEPAITHVLDVAKTRPVILLVHNSTDTRWWQAASGQCEAICLVHGRIKFINAATGEPGVVQQGQHFMYFGPRVGTFYKVFEAFGTIIRHA